MPTFRSLVILLTASASLTACATVSVYEPVSADIALTQDQSQLHQASDAFSNWTRDEGLATGEASLASLAGILNGKQSDAGAYWRKIGADTSAPATVVTRLRDDMNKSIRSLADIDAQARALLGKGEPARLDVTAFERALIHARQSRDSFSDALTEVNKRAEKEYMIAQELAPLDAALAHARLTADDLAAARTDPHGGA